MKRYVLIILLAIVAISKPCASYAQFKSFPKEDEKPKMKFKDRLFVGGGVQLSFGTVTAIGASPIVGLRITDKLSAGVGFDYVYIRDKRYKPFIYQTSIYGANVFGRYKIFKTLFAQAEYGFFNWDYPVYDPLTGQLLKNRVTTPFLNLGGGIIQPLGSNSSIVIMALYDVLYNPPYSYNPSPLTFKAGVNIGF